jgi:type II secretory pathway pseudopilin PulG
MTELLVAVMVLAVLLAMTTTFFLSSSRASSTNSSIDTATRDASNAMNSMTRTIRAAAQNPRAASSGTTVPDDAFVVASPTTLTVYSFVDLTSTEPRPSRVTFAVNARGELVETRVQGSPSAAGAGYWTYTAAATTRVLARSVVGTALFSYGDGDENVLGAGSAALTGDEIANVASVTVRLTVGKGTSTASSVSLQNTVGLPNLDVTRKPL